MKNFFHVCIIIMSFIMCILANQVQIEASSDSSYGLDYTDLEKTMKEIEAAAIQETHLMEEAILRQQKALEEEQEALEKELEEERVRQAQRALEEKARQEQRALEEKARQEQKALADLHSMFASLYTEIWREHNATKTLGKNVKEAFDTEVSKLSWVTRNYKLAHNSDNILVKIQSGVTKRFLPSYKDFVADLKIRSIDTVYRYVNNKYGQHSLDRTEETDTLITEAIDSSLTFKNVPLFISLGFLGSLGIGAEDKAFEEIRKYNRNFYTIDLRKKYAAALADVIQKFAINASKIP